MNFLTNPFHAYPLYANVFYVNVAVLTRHRIRDTFMFAVAVVCVMVWVVGADLRHQEGAPRHVPIPTIAAYSLNSACQSELRDICELRSPFGDRAIKCFEGHKSELSGTCAEWHTARMECKNQIEGSTFEGCPDCKSFCGRGKSLLHCIRAAGTRILSLGVDERCTDTAFYKSMHRRSRAKVA